MNPAALGPLLREKRERIGMTLAQISQRTKISPATLAAIEDDRTPATLPELFYRAHLREILAAMGENPQEWDPRIAEFLNIRRKPAEMSPRFRTVDVRRLMGIGGGGAILAVILIWGLAPRERTAVVSSGSAVEAGEGAVRVTLISREFTSVQYQLDGEEPRQVFLREGEQTELAARQRLKLILFKPKSVDVYRDGKKVDKLEWLGSVARLTFP